MSEAACKMVGLWLMVIGVGLVAFGIHAPKGQSGLLPVALVAVGLVTVLVGFVLHVVVEKDDVS